MADLLKPTEITVEDQDGGPHTYTISRMDCVTAREVIAKYPLSAAPKIGDYRTNEETMLKLMGFVAVQAGEKQLRLETLALVKNHVPDFETLARIEWAMLAHNYSFLRAGKNFDSLSEIFQKALNSISKTLTDSLAQSLAQGKPPSTN